MTNYSHETAPTQFVEAGGVRFAYRRFGKPGTVPLLFLGYFNSNMDCWDPAVTNSLAADHEVILFDNAGVAASRGETPNLVVEMTPHCVAFCRKEDRDLPVSRNSAVAQLAAIREWGIIPVTDRYAALKNITHPTLIVHGNKDIVVRPINALILVEHLPNAQLIVYSDSSHGAQYQHGKMFLEHVKLFLSDGDSPVAALDPIPIESSVCLGN